MLLQALHEEMINWPFLNDEETLEKGQNASYARVTNIGEDEGAIACLHACDMLCGCLTSMTLASLAGRALPKPMKRDKNEAAKNVLDLLPDWVGYGVSPPLVCLESVLHGHPAMRTDHSHACTGPVCIQVSPGFAGQLLHPLA